MLVTPMPVIWLCLTLAAGAGMPTRAIPVDGSENPAAGGEADGQPYEYAVVTVNGRAITRSYLALRMGDRLKELEKIREERKRLGLWNARDVEMYGRAIEVMRAQAVRSVVFGEILRTEGEKLTKMGFRVSERMVEQYWRDMLDRAGGPAALARERGLSVAALKEIAQDEILAEAYRQNLRMTLASPTPQEVADFYRYNSESFRRPESVRARVIFIERTLTDPATGRRVERRDARKRAEEVLKKVAAGEDFARLARRYSDDIQSAGEGGLLGSDQNRFLVERRDSTPQFEPVLYGALFELGAGEASGIVEGPGHYYLVRIEDRFQAGVPPLSEIEDEVRRQCYAERARQEEEEVFRRGFSRVLVLDEHGRRLTLDDLLPERAQRPSLFDRREEEDEEDAD